MDPRRVLQAVILCVIPCASLFAQDDSDITVPDDTVWVETSYQRYARSQVEEKNDDIAKQAENIRLALLKLGLMHIAPTSNVTEDELVRSDLQRSHVTAKDRTSFRARLHAELEDLKAQHEHNCSMLEVLRSNLRRRKSYYLTTQLQTKPLWKIPVPAIDSIRLLRYTTPGAIYYKPDDWLNIHLLSSPMALGK